MLLNRINRHILPQIGQRLLERGKCERDPTCPHGYSQKCTCPQGELETKLEAIRADTMKRPGCIAAWHNPLEPSPWPCANWLNIYFDIPRPPRKEDGTYEYINIEPDEPIQRINV